jgi:hypothetical protein
MATDTPVAAATTKDETEFSLRNVLGGDTTPVPVDPAQAVADAKAQAEVTVNLTEAPAEPDPSPALEGDVNADSTSEKSQGDASDDQTTAEPEPEKPMSKHEREKFKLREARNKERAEKEKLAKELAELKAQYAIEPDEPEVDANAEAIHAARMQERIALSKARFLERENGEALLAEKFTNTDSPWSEIEAQAKLGDPRATQMVARASQAIDPFAEAFNILEEQALFEQYGTTSLSQIIAKALAEEEEAMEKRIMAKINKPVSDIGKATKTLGRVNGQIPPAQAHQTEEVSPLKAMFGKT